MKIFKSLDTVFLKDTAITIGNFDGVHLGHIQLIDALKRTGKTTGVVTFSNHPMHILTPKADHTPLYSLEQNLQFLKEVDVDFVVLLTFTKQLANQSYTEFLSFLKKHLDFSDLILGKGSTIGKNKKGTQEKIEAFGHTLDFKCQFLEKKKINNIPISTSKIKQLLLKNDTVLAEKMLSRKYTGCYSSSSSSSSSG
ncbi:MAG: Riboflavin biosynthesis protein RibF [Chlamydiae bacterium]|nr:Riboflavin biosynthesis protein RibF [Chlamydiota bacterium]